MNFVDQIYKKIVNIEIQGATSVCEAVLLALKKESADKKMKTSADLIRSLHRVGHYLSRARATEPMAENAVRFVEHHLRQNREMELKELRVLIKRGIDGFLFRLATNKKNIRDVGERLIEDEDNVFTHCHSSTVIDVLAEAKKNKKKIHVFNTETRPLFQGRITSKELIKKKIENTQVVDSAGPFFVSQYTKDYDMDVLLLGCDAISQSGDAVNKIGSLGLALAAKEADIPVYIATQSLKLDLDAKYLKNLEIEKRPSKEIWPGAPEGVEIINYAFDIIPAKYITGFITELGVLKPKRLAKSVKAAYPFLI
ncbi:MAG TPA: translation initiation factor eIF-2B [Candidatus Bipolaricaulota bacterium]|nr:translation initiation factor eIF-2B [Candidatus Bipolaricaulota bacterium]